MSVELEEGKTYRTRNGGGGYPVNMQESETVTREAE